MTETQTPNHGAPLAPGEIRTHTVGTRTFRVMHTSGGSFTQASVRADGEPAQVLKTSMHEHEAVRAYAEAIEQAESDAIDALDDADGPSFDASGNYLDGEDDDVAESAADAALSYNLPDGADSALVRGERIETPAEPIGDGTGELQMVVFGNAGDMRTAVRHLAALSPWPGDSLRELLDAYSEATARAAYHVALGGLGAARRQVERAGALKAEIIKRYDRPAGDR